MQPQMRALWVDQPEVRIEVDEPAQIVDEVLAMPHDELPDALDEVDLPVAQDGEPRDPQN